MAWHERVNAWLASELSVANAAAAIVIIVGTTVSIGSLVTPWILGMIIGITVGAVIAVFVCGVVATLIAIRNSLE